jgi:hypothetical protein
MQENKVSEKSTENSLLSVKQELLFKKQGQLLNKFQLRIRF